MVERAHGLLPDPWTPPCMAGWLSRGLPGWPAARLAVRLPGCRAAWLACGVSWSACPRVRGVPPTLLRRLGQGGGLPRYKQFARNSFSTPGDGTSMGEPAYFYNLGVTVRNKCLHVAACAGASSAGRALKFSSLHKALL